MTWKQKVGAVAITVIIFITVVFFATRPSKKQVEEAVKAKAAQAAAEHARTNPPPARVVALVPAPNPWTFKMITIPKGGIAVRLYNGWKTWPKGGAILITTPNMEVLKDQPGVINHFGDQPDGIYLITSDPVGIEGRKVEIYNRW